MRTISQNLKQRLIAQVDEANFQGLDKIAARLVHQVKNNPTRQDYDEYVYSNADLQNDVENLLWSAVVRTQDYFGKTANARDLGDLIESFADEFISSIRTKIGGGVIGPHEPLVPGETRAVVEIDEDA